MVPIHSEEKEAGAGGEGECVGPAARDPCHEGAASCRRAAIAPPWALAFARGRWSCIPHSRMFHSFCAHCARRKGFHREWHAERYSIEIRSPTNTFAAAARRPRRAQARYLAAAGLQLQLGSRACCRALRPTGTSKRQFALPLRPHAQPAFRPHCLPRALSEALLSAAHH